MTITSYLLVVVLIVNTCFSGDESIVAQVDENMFTLDDHPLDVTVAVEQGEGIPKKARETLCSTRLQKQQKSENQSVMLLLKQQKH
ncbi:hypothetical protein TNCV_221941 [Trichonephila clavipes]|nr:hypothetical protein TNCV_221941 [Trichonephila clavipes]